MSRVLPILFNGDMVRAILDGRKTVTRRLVKKLPDDAEFSGWLPDSTCQEDAKDIGSAGFKTQKQPTEKAGCVFVKPPYQNGDILYVRETWGISNLDYDDKIAYITYKSSENEKDEGCRAVRLPDDKFEKIYDSMAENALDWHPSIHMPKEAARICLKVKDVRVERLREITEEQVDAEGFRFKPPCLSMVSADGHYCDLDGPCTSSIKYCDMSIGELYGKELWNSTIKKSDLDRYGWDANPWVWVIEFERCEKPERWCV